MNNSLNNKAVFLDKDGTLIPDIPYNIDPSLINIEDDVIQGLKILQQQQFRLIVISNQSGVAKGYFSEKDLLRVFERISALLKPHDIFIDEYFYCPHADDGMIAPYAISCDCRKPLPGMFLKAASLMNIDLSSSWMIGDILNDIEAGNVAGCSTVLLDNGNETEWLVSNMRMPYLIAKNMLEAAQFIITEESQAVHYE